MGGGGKTAEEEYEDLKKSVIKAVKNPVIFEESRMVHRIKEGSDIVVFDFGGLMPGTNLGTDQSRALIQYAQDHPSTLILIISDFTFTRFIQPEMDDLGLKELRNVKLWSTFPGDFPDWPGITRSDLSYYEA